MFFTFNGYFQKIKQKKYAGKITCFRYSLICENVHNHLLVCLREQPTDLLLKLIIIIIIIISQISECSSS